MYTELKISTTNLRLVFVIVLPIRLHLLETQTLRSETTARWTQPAHRGRQDWRIKEGEGMAKMQPTTRSPEMSSISSDVRLSTKNVNAMG